MNEAWIGLIGALAGTLAGGLLSHFMDKARFLRERSWEWTSTRLSKYEQIGETAEKLRLYFADLASSGIKWAEGRATADYAKQLEQEKPVTSQLAILVSLYAPSLAPALRQIEEASRQFYRCFGELAAKPRLESQAFNQAALKAMLDAQQHVDAACFAFLKDLANCARHLTNELGGYGGDSDARNS